MLPKVSPALNDSVLGSFRMNETRNYHHINCNNRETSKGVSLTRKSNGYVWHCYKCSSSGFHSITGYHAPSAATKGSSDRGALRVTSYPPNGAVQDCSKSVQASEYIKRYLGTRELQANQGVHKTDGAHESICFRTERGYTERRLTGGGPKWLHRGGAGDYWYKGTSDVLVLTEDILSAMLVSEHESAMAVLGTHVSDALVQIILDYGYKKALIWFDDDSSIVQRQQMKACVKLQNYVQCTVVHTGTDPKNMPDSIEKVILEAKGYFVN